MSDDFMNQFDPPRPPRPEFTAALYQRFKEPVKTNSRTRVLRILAASMAIAAVVAAFVFFSPTTHAFADSIIRQFGNYVFVQATPPPDPVKGSAAAQDDSNASQKPPATSPAEIATQQAQAGEIATLQAAKQQAAAQQAGQVATQTGPKTGDAAQPVLDPAAASQLAGFTVLAPAYVPAGYAVTDPQGAWTVSHDQEGVTASIHYDNADSFLVIDEQQPQPGAANTIDRPDIQDVTVRGQSGAWIPDPDGHKSILVWQENGLTYMLVSNTLAQAQLLQVAESLGK
jgi:hypothetical protein